MSAESLPVEPTLHAILEEMIEDLGLDYDGTLGRSTTLVGDLGFASVDFIHLIVETESRFGRKMGFHDLIMPGGVYVEDLALGPLADFIASRLAEPSEKTEQAAPPPAAEPETVGNSVDSGVDNGREEPVVSPADYARFLTLLPPVSAWGVPEPPPRKNRRMIFVLSSPRSGSTLLRVMLAGNPALFAPPELHLLTYPDMARRKQALANEQNAQLLTGTIRAVMQLRGVEAEVATRYLEECEAAAMPVHAFYARLLEEAGERWLIDKSPTYPMRPEFLTRMEAEFDAPLYLHLVRHPCGMIKSFEDGKMEQLVPFMRESDFSRRQLAELGWLLTNGNIRHFLENIPAERQMRVQYEALVRNPRSVMEAVCGFFRVPFEAAMLRPYDDQGSRMTDGLRMASEFSGDLKFHLHAGIEPGAADRWRRTLSEAGLGEPTRELAAALGYSLSC